MQRPARSSWSLRRRQMGVPMALALGLAALAVAPATAAASTRSAAVNTVTSPWTTQAALGTTYVLSSALACASSTDCYALGRTDGEEVDGFLVSSDSGQLWTSASVPAGTADFDVIACPAVATCFIAGPGGSGTVMYETQNSGTSWAAIKVPASISLDALTCRSATWCVAGGFSTTGNASVVTTNGGTSWTRAATPGEAIGTISCPSTTVCYSASDGGYTVDITTDGAKAWKALTLPKLTALLTGIACETTTGCVVVGAKEVGATADPLALVTTDSGTGWKTEAMPSGLSILLGVSCPSTKVCVTINTSASTGTSSAVVTTDGGAAWKSYPLTVESNVLSFLTPTGGVVACPSTSICITSGATGAGNDRMVYSSTGGATWRTATLPVGGFVDSLGCWSASACAGAELTNSGPMTEVTSNGTTWAPQALSGYVGVGDIICSATETCVAIGETSALKFAFIETTNGGTTWSTLASYSFAVGTDPLSLACPSVNVCYATFSVPNGGSGSATELEHSSNGGTSWSSVAIPKAVAATGFGTVTCSTTTDCTLSAANGSIEYTTSSGTTWATAVLPTGFGQAGPMSCGSATACVTFADGSAATVSTIVSTDSGERWTTAAGLPSDFNGQAIVCTGAADCELLGSSGVGAPLSYSTTTTGSSWTSQPAPARLGSTGQWHSLACPAVGRCEASAVGPAGAGYLFGLG
jgi:hypothetical protein